MIRASAEHPGNLNAGRSRRPPRLDRLGPLFQVGESTIRIIYHGLYGGLLPRKREIVDNGGAIDC